MHPRSARWPWAWTPLLALVLAAPARSAAPPVELERIWVGFPSATQTQQYYKVGAWTPIRVQLSAGLRQGFSGVLEVVVPDDDGAPTAFRQPIQLGPGETRAFTSYFRRGKLNVPGAIDDQVALAVYDAKGKRFPLEIPPTFLASVTSLLPGEILLLTLGHPQGVELIPTLPGFSSSPGVTRNNNAETSVQVGGLEPGAMPGRSIGYDAVEAVILDANDRAVMEALRARGQALTDWVRNGGHLIVAVGSNGQMVRDPESGLEPMLPALPNGRVPVRDLGALETFANSKIPLAPTGAPPVEIARLELVPGRGGRILDASAGSPLVVRGPFGFGRVTVVALDVDQKPFATWPDRKLFWANVLKLRNMAEDTSTNPGAPGTAGYYNYGVSDLATVLHSDLERFPGIKLIPFGWVAFFIFVYILLIGPGDYFFLKKVVKRMELTWITFPLIVLTVSALAYVTAYAVKGTDLRINKVDVVDLDQATGQVRGSTWMTLFSPQNRDYTLSLKPVGLEGGPVRDGGSAWGTGGAEERMITWFGAPEAGFGGMNNPNRLGLSSSGYAYEPLSEVEALAGVRIPIWSTKSFTGRWSATSPPVVDAALEPAGPDRLAGTLTNRLNKSLRNAVLVFGRQVYPLGDLPPGTPVTVERNRNQTLSGFIETKTTALRSYQAWNEASTISRTDLLRAMMFFDSLEVRRPFGSHALRYLDLTGQLALDRPMLVAELEGPAVDLVLKGASGAPITDQTTLVRAILPLGKAADEEGAGGESAPEPEPGR